MPKIIKWSVRSSSPSPHNLLCVAISNHELHDQTRTRLTITQARKLGCFSSPLAVFSLKIPIIIPTVVYKSVKTLFVWDSRKNVESDSLKNIRYVVIFTVLQGYPTVLLMFLCLC